MEISQWGAISASSSPTSTVYGLARELERKLADALQQYERVKIERNGAIDRAQLMFDAKNNWADRARAAEARTSALSEIAGKSELEAIAAQLEMAYGDLPRDIPPGPPTSIVKRLREIASVPSAIPQKWLVRAGGDAYETWLCATREDVRTAFIEALYGDVATAQAEATGDIAGYMERFDDPKEWAERGNIEIRWDFEDGWLEVIALGQFST